MAAALLCACDSNNDFAYSADAEVVNKVKFSVPEFVEEGTGANSKGFDIELLPQGIDSQLMDGDIVSRANVSGALKFTWSSTDKVGVWPTLREGEETSASQVLFSQETGSSANSAMFKGSGWGLLHDRKYYAYYPYSEDATPTCVRNYYSPVSYQTTNANTGHLGGNLAMYASAITPSSGSSAEFQFHHFSSLIRISISLPTELKSTLLKSVQISCDEDVFPVETTYNPTEDQAQETVLEKTNKQTLLLGAQGAGFKPLVATIYVWFMIGACDLEGKTINVLVSDGANYYEGQFVGANQRAGYGRQYETKVAKRAVPDDCVDMGTGVYWAVSNLGASAPEHFGDYYAWGETKPYYSSITMNETGENASCASVTWLEDKSSGYAWSNYFDTNTSGSTFIKYTTGKQVLELQDDAAHAIKGGSWRMPTTEEVVALYKICDMKAEEVNGVRGIRFTSRTTKNSIFIPGSGYFSGTKYDCGASGYRLWSSTLESKKSAYGWFCGYSEVNDVNKQVARDRYRGQCIRAVFDPSM